MATMRIKDDNDTDPVVSFYLEQDGDDVNVHAESDGDSAIVAYFSPDGKLHVVDGAFVSGLTTDRDGRVVVVKH